MSEPEMTDDDFCEYWETVLNLLDQEQDDANRDYDYPQIPPDDYYDFFDDKETSDEPKPTT